MMSTCQLKVKGMFVVGSFFTSSPCFPILKKRKKRRRREKHNSSSLYSLSPSLSLSIYIYIERERGRERERLHNSPQFIIWVGETSSRHVLSITSKRVIRFLSISFREKKRKKERMGNCFSNVEGGKQAVGETQQRPNSIATTNNNNGGHNDAVEFFFKFHGI